MRILFFVQQDCPKCPAAKKLFADFNHEEKELMHVDEDAEALAWFTYCGLRSTPAVVVVNDADDIVKAWTGADLPTIRELGEVCNVR